MADLSLRYYINNDFHNDFEFNDIESVVVFLNKTTHEEGEFFIREYSAIKIKYNLNSGKVKAVSAEPHKGRVKNFYSRDAFQHVLRPVSDAISLLAKFELLLALNNLRDKEITQIIYDNHTCNDGEKFINISHAAVNKTFNQIIQCIRPTTKNQNNKTHQVLFEIFSEFPLNELKSRNDVLKWSDLIHDKLR